MAANPGHDVFVSYAHADNGVPVGFPHGWVTALASNLNEGPNNFPKRLFIDHELQPGDNFSSELLTRVERSALLVILLSQNYIDSAWCGQELAHFIRTHSTNSDNPSDVYVVELFPYERLTAVPQDIQDLRKRLIHAKFWYQRRDASEPSVAGYPSASECEPDGRTHYWNVLNELRVTLDTRLRFLRTQSALAAAVSRSQDLPIQLPPAHLRDPLGTVLLADTTDDLEAQRNEVRIALKAEGVVVLPEGDYVGFTPPEFEAAIAHDVQRADLFVQLLSPTPGRKGKGFELPMPQLQYRYARSAKLPILQWCERLPAAEQIADEAHARLFHTDTLRATHLSEFKTTVIERLRALKAPQPLPVPPPEPDQSKFPPHKWQIFVDDLASEVEISERLRAVIREHAYAVRSLPSGAPLGNNGVDIKELLRPCRAGITIYTDRSKYSTAYNRLVYFLNQVAEGSLPLTRWGVYLQQGTVASEFGIESDEVVPIDEHGLDDFLRGL